MSKLFFTTNIQGTTANGITRSKAILGSIIPIDKGTTWELDIYNGSADSDAVDSNLIFKWVTAMGYGQVNLNFRASKGLLIKSPSGTTGNVLITYTPTT